MPFRNTRGERERFTENVNYNATINYLTGESIAWQSRDGTVSYWLSCLHAFNKLLFQDRLPAGTNVFPFAFNLPINCAPSFEGCHGHIRYDVHVELDRPWKFNKKSRKCFSGIFV